VKEFVEKRNPSVCILTPCYGGQCQVDYIVCLINTFILFSRANIPLHVEFCKNDSLVTRARNNLVAKALTNKSFTHIMFIDSDISWNSIDIIKLILNDKPIVGGVYPLKNYNISRLTENESYLPAILKKKKEYQTGELLSDEEFLKHNLLDYNANFIDNTVRITQNLIQLKHIANGFMMIQREVFARLIKEFPETKYTDDVGFLKQEENANAYAFFNTGVMDDHFLSEDWFFCETCKKLGYDIYADVSINLHHSGIHTFQGSFMASLMANITDN